MQIVRLIDSYTPTKVKVLPKLCFLNNPSADDMQMMHSCTEESLMTLMRVHYRMIWTTCKSGRKRG